jgi:predicted RNA-binding protein YlxR (DUF448 family)
MCALTREVLPERDLIRFVPDPQGKIVPDIKADLPGRGVWVRLDRDKVAQAARRGAFGRSLKMQVAVPPDLPDQVARLLRQAALGRLGLARKAGEAVAGFAKVEAAVRSGRIAALLTAVEAAGNGVEKMAAAVRRHCGDRPGHPWWRMFTEAELGLAIGRAHVIHAAVIQGPAGRNFVDAVTRLKRYEGAGGVEPAQPAIETPGRTND